MWNAGVWRQLEWPQDEREMSVGQRMMCRRAGAHRYLQLGPGSAAHGCALRRARDKTLFLFCLLYGRFIVELYNHHQPHSWLGWMSPAIIYAAQRRQAALRSTDGSAPRTAAIPELLPVQWTAG